MEMHDRIKDLRKNKLHMSQTEFAESLGVSRSVISNIELDALKRPDQKAPLVKLISKKYGINEQWLLTGEGSPDEVEEFSLDAFARQHGASDLDIQVLKAFFSVDPDTRKKFVEQFKKFMLMAEQGQSNSFKKKSPADMTEEDIRKAADDYADRLREEKKQAAESSASNITGDAEDVKSRKVQ